HPEYDASASPAYGAISIPNPCTRGRMLPCAASDGKGVRGAVNALPRPHGGARLSPRLLQGSSLEDERQRASSLPRIPVSSRERGDLIMLGIGGFTPLEGFMTSADWRGVCSDMRLESGLFWPIPITLSATQAVADSVAEGSDAALV